MARLLGWHTISDVAVLMRLRGCLEFLRSVISAVLARRVEVYPRPSLRVCFVDATTISRPGSDSTNWRLPVVYGLFPLQL